jgi:hypothetical protein
VTTEEKKEFETLKVDIDKAVLNSLKEGGDELYKLHEKESFKKEFFTKLGIIGGGYAVLEKFTNETLLLFR